MGEALATGWGHGCAAQNGRVWCWGSNHRDEVGDPRVGAAPRPVRGPDLGSIVELAAGRTSTCARHQDGRVTCWGDGSPDLRDVGKLEDAVELAFASGRLCVRREGGRAQCWSSWRSAESPKALPLRDVVALAGDCAIDRSGRQRCFKQSRRALPTGAVRVPEAKMAGHAFAAKPPQIQAARRAALQHVAKPCVLRADRTVGCWSNDFRLPPMGPSVDSDGLMTVEGIADAAQIAVGREFLCARLTGGQVTCTTAPTASEIPVTHPEGIEGIDDAVQIVAGQAHVCARRNTGAVACWGANDVGQLGDGTFEPRRSVVEIPELRVVDLAAGDFHTCGRTQEGQLWCWGLGEQGQLGDRFTARGERDFATEVLNLPEVAQVVSLAGRTCAREPSGVIWCWGLGSHVANPFDPLCHPGPDGRVVCPAFGGGGSACGRQLDSRLDGAHPRRVDGVTARDLKALGTDLMVLNHDGEILFVSQMMPCGVSNDALRTKIRLLAKVGGAVELAVAGSVCVRTSSGAVYCSAPIEPSHEDPLSDLTLAVVPGIDDATALAVGYRHACALRTTGIVTCWEAGPSDQLGNNLPGGPTDPVDVPGLDRITDIAAGWYHTCARRSDGTLWCWGENDGGSLGDGTTDDRATPTQVVELDDVAAVAASQWQSCAWHGSGKISCWGAPPRPSYEPVTRPVQAVQLLQMVGQASAKMRLRTTTRR